MLEAVNSVLSNAPLTKTVVQQQSVMDSFSGNPARVQQVSLQAPYISLYIKVDTNFDRAILQIRDSDTGDVVRQIPTESQLEAYRRAQSSNAVRPATVQEEGAPVAETPDLFAAQDVSASSGSTPSPQPTFTPASGGQSFAGNTASTPSAPATVSIDTQV